MEWRKKKKDNDIFDIWNDDLEKEFERIQKHIVKALKNIYEGDLKHIEDIKTYGPFIYGFSMRIGEDGRPMIREFGNRCEKLPVVEREPLTDLIEGKENIAVTVEIPGVDKECIDLSANENTLTISVHTPQRKYHKTIELPSKIIPDSTKATYKNGVLDVVMKKAIPTPEKVGRRIVIE